jgi:hypothetical protein
VRTFNEVFTLGQNDHYWGFADGVQIHVMRDRDKPRRVYVGFKDWTVMEDLHNRTRRPYQLWKEPMLEALARIGVEPETARWSQKAGCSCPCSPGFVINGDRIHNDYSYWITLPGVPTVDESLPERSILI